MNDHIRKYPRTPHIRGSKLQSGDEDLDTVPVTELAGRHLVIEEKIDGANAGISFDAEGNLRLQSRGHFLTGGGRERHFNLFKQWANRHLDALFDMLGDRYILYGEWMYSKHTEFYDRLPHYFFEFDILDRSTGSFLSTAERRRVIGKGPVESVPVLYEGRIRKLDELVELIQPSSFKSPRWRQTLEEVAIRLQQDPELIAAQTSASDLAEGIYIKEEENGVVKSRFKFVRSDFRQAIEEAKASWHDRTIIPNQLVDGVDILGDDGGGKSGGSTDSGEDS